MRPTDTDAPPLHSDPVPTRAERDRADRLAREAQALRDNLRRRKQQSRARQDASETPEPPPPEPLNEPPDDC